MDLKVYENGVTEWVIAESPEDATAIMLREGVDWEEHPEDPWTECNLDTVWTLAADFTDDGKPLALPFREWIERKGRGFLGTTEY